MRSRVVCENDSVAVLDDPPIVEQQYLIATFKSRQVMGDDDRRAILHELVDGTLNKLLRTAIEALRRLVQYHDAGVLEKSASKGEKLGLSGGQPVAVGLQFRVQPVRQPAQPRTET